MLWCEPVGEGVLRFETVGGFLGVVSQDDGEAYQQMEQIHHQLTDIEAQGQAVPAKSAEDIHSYDEDSAIRKIWNDYAQPTEGLDIRQALTSVHENQDDPNSRQLTVAEMATRDLYAKYSAEISAGNLDKNNLTDARVRLVYLLDLQDARANGRPFLPTTEDGTFGVFDTPRPGDATVLKGGRPNTVSAADMQAMSNTGKVESALTAALQDATVQKDYQDALNNAVNTVPDRAAVAKKIAETLESPELLRGVAALKQGGYEQQAQAKVQGLLGSLALIDPAQAQATAQKLQMNVVASALDGILANPASIDATHLDSASLDVTNMLARFLRSFGGVTRHGVNTADKFINGYLNDSTNRSYFQKVLGEMLKDGDPERLGAADFDKNIQSIMDRTYVPLKERAGLQRFLGELHNAGIWGTITGLGGLLGAIYQLTGGAEHLSSDWTERLAVARNFMATLAVAPHLVNTFSFLADQVGKVAGFKIDPTIADQMGTHKLLPEIWNEKSLLPKALDDFILPTRPAQYGMADELGKLILAESPSPQPLTGSNAMRGIGSAARIFAAIFDLGGGLADVVLGSMDIKKAIDAKDPTAAAFAGIGGGLKIAGGAMVAAGGALATAELFTVFAAAAWANPLFLAGSLISGAAILVDLLGLTSLDDIRGNPELEKIKADQDATFQRWADMGVLKEDWGRQKDVINNELYKNGRVNTDSTKPLVEQVA